VHLDGEILENSEVGPERYKMVVYCPQIAREAKPGQFVHIRVSEGYNPLLRRPFSVHRVRGQEFSILYKVVGKGTEILSRKKKGEYLDILGPLGQGYRLAELASNISQSILVAGGTGVASLLFLAESILASGSKLPILVLIGAKNREEILCERDFRRLGCRVEVATEDGTTGYKGLVSQLLEKLLSPRETPRKPLVFACGPQEMLKRIGEISRRYRFSCQVSLEERMACGVGACLGCAVRVKNSPYIYKRACKDGPVFDIGELIWE